MIEMTGNIFTSTAPAVGHGVNCQGVMGSGIAVQFRTLFPEMFRQYKALCNASLLVPGEVFPFQTENFLVYNIASQRLPGANATLEWLEEGLHAVLSDAEDRGYDRVALPQIGCGIGGLDIADVRPLIISVEAGSSMEFEFWTYQG